VKTKIDKNTKNNLNKSTKLLNTSHLKIQQVGKISNNI
jgi:hypothetical protein